MPANDKNVRSSATRAQLKAVARKHRTLGVDYDAAFRRGAAQLRANPSYSEMEDLAKHAQKEAHKSRKMTILNAELEQMKPPIEGQLH